VPEETLNNVRVADRLRSDVRREDIKAASATLSSDLQEEIS
jgi:hypothetical protein